MQSNEKLPYALHARPDGLLQDREKALYARDSQKQLRQFASVNWYVCSGLMKSCLQGQLLSAAPIIDPLQDREKKQTQHACTTGFGQALACATQKVFSQCATAQMCDAMRKWPYPILYIYIPIELQEVRQTEPTQLVLFWPSRALRGLRLAMCDKGFAPNHACWNLVIISLQLTKASARICKCALGIYIYIRYSQCANCITSK